MQKPWLNGPWGSLCRDEEIMCKYYAYGRTRRAESHISNSTEWRTVNYRSCILPAWGATCREKLASNFFVSKKRSPQTIFSIDRCTARYKPDITEFNYNSIQNLLKNSRLVLPIISYYWMFIYSFLWQRNCHIWETMDLIRLQIRLSSLIIKELLILLASNIGLLISL